MNNYTRHKYLKTYKKNLLIFTWSLTRKFKSNYHYLPCILGLHFSPLTNGRFHKAPVRVNSTKHVDASRSEKLSIIMKR